MEALRTPYGVRTKILVLLALVFATSLYALTWQRLEVRRQEIIAHSSMRAEVAAKEAAAGIVGRLDTVAVAGLLWEKMVGTHPEGSIQSRIRPHDLNSIDRSTERLAGRLGIYRVSVHEFDPTSGKLNTLFVAPTKDAAKGLTWLSKEGEATLLKVWAKMAGSSRLAEARRDRLAATSRVILSDRFVIKAGKPTRRGAAPPVMGRILGVPIWSDEEQAVGVLSIVLTESKIASALPSGDFAILAGTTEGAITAATSGAFSRTSKAGSVGSLEKAGTLRLDVWGPGGQWKLWYGVTAESVEANPQFQGAVREALLFALVVTVLLACALGFLRVHIVSRRRLTERNTALEREVREQTQRLVEAQQMESIGQMSAGIAHEINTPIQFVQNNLQFLSEAAERLEAAWLEVESSSDSPERVKEVAQSVAHYREEIRGAVLESLEGARRVGEIVRAMKLHVHSGGTGYMDESLNRIVESSVTLARNEWKPYGVVRFELNKELPTVSCHPGQLRQMVLNLVVNAAHALAESGRTPADGLITVRTSTEDYWVALEVTDNGCGMSPEVSERIFDLYYTTKEPGKGTGMGMAVVAEAIRAHGGWVEVDSEPGVGTSIRVYLDSRLNDLESLQAA